MTATALRLGLAAVSLGALTIGCGGDDPAAPDGAGGQASGDAAAQSLEAVALDDMAPVSGRSARNLMRVEVWATEQVNAACGIDHDLSARADDRYDQARFPDFDRIASEGIGLGVAVEDQDGAPPAAPPPGAPAGGAGAAGGEPTQEEVDEYLCLQNAVPELTARYAVSEAWFRDVVEPTVASPESQSRAGEATSCLRDEMSMSADELPDLFGFFAALDGRASSLIAAAGGDDPGAAVGQLDDAAADAFTTCAQAYYEWLGDQLADARPDFVDQHRETIEAFTAVLAQRGYVP